MFPDSRAVDGFGTICCVHNLEKSTKMQKLFRTKENIVLFYMFEFSFCIVHRQFSRFLCCFTAYDLFAFLSVNDVKTGKLNCNVYWFIVNHFCDLKLGELLNLCDLDTYLPSKYGAVLCPGLLDLIVGLCRRIIAEMTYRPVAVDQWTDWTASGT